MKLYRGVRDENGIARVYAIVPERPNRLLDPRFDMLNQSYCNLDWGYVGPGAAQCAIAILADAIHDDVRAVHMHARFGFRVIGRLPRHLPWELTADRVRAIVEKNDVNAYAC